jgi:WD40 repeat protein
VSAAFSPDGTRVVTASWDDTARVWHAATGKPVTRPLEHQARVNSVAFSPDGACRRVSAGVGGGCVRSEGIRTLRSVSAAFSPDGTHVVTASVDQTARVWDAATGKALTYPLEHQGPVVSAAFSPDGTRIVTASADNTTQVCDAVTGKSVTTLEHQGMVWSAAFSPDGTRVVTASHRAGRPIRARSGTPEQWAAVAERSPFVLDGVALVRRALRSTSKPMD